jgi:hypothetical protein
MLECGNLGSESATEVVVNVGKKRPSTEVIALSARKRQTTDDLVAYV